MNNYFADTECRAYVKEPSGERFISHLPLLARLLSFNLSSLYMICVIYWANEYKKRHRKIFPRDSYHNPKQLLTAQSGASLQSRTLHRVSSDRVSSDRVSLVTYASPRLSSHVRFIVYHGAVVLPSALRPQALTTSVTLRAACV